MAITLEPDILLSFTEGRKCWDKVSDMLGKISYETKEWRKG